MERAWVRPYAAVGLVAMVLYFVAPGGEARAAIFITLNVAALLTILYGVRRYRPRRSLPWLVLASGYTSYACADVIWFSNPPFPSYADALFLVAYLLLAVGLGTAIRARGSRADRGGALDALIVTGGIGVLSWMFVMSPQLQDGALTTQSQIVALAYPTVDLLLLGTLVRQSFLIDGRRSFFALLSAGFIAQLAADTGYAITVTQGTFSFRHPIMAGYLLSFIFVGAAALHPSMRAFTEQISEGRPVTRAWRLALLGASALVPPVILIAEAVAGRLDHIPQLAIISGLVFLLVLARVGQVLSDLSERRRIESKLREAESNYRHLVEQLPGVVYTADTGPEGHWTYVSPQIGKMLGYSPEEWMGDPTLWSQRLHPDDRERVVSGEESAVEDGSDYPHDEYRLLARDGHIVWVRDEATLARDEQGRPFFRGVLFDITDRKALEDQLRQSQKMEAIGLLAGGISHDFNNLLAIVQNYASFVAEEIPEHDPKHQDLQEVIRAAKRGARLTRQLLTFSRREVVQPRVLDLNEVVSDMQKMLSRTLPANVELTTSLAPRLWKTKMDPGQVEQIIMNLAVNAKDAMPLGGRLTVATGNTELDADGLRPQGLSAGAYVTLAVSDTGCGMTEDVLERIFEPFFTTKAKGHGTGLGLATVYGIVEQAHGHIAASSTIDKGTTFTVYLPRTVEEGAAETTVATEDPKAHKGGAVILVAEDEDAVRDLVARVLRRRGYTVKVAESGMEAIRLARESAEGIDLLLTDVVMPDVSGREVSTRTGLPTMFMSGYTDEIITEQGVLPEQETLLEKPFSAAELLATVRGVLAAGSRSRSG